MLPPDQEEYSYFIKQTQEEDETSKKLIIDNTKKIEERMLNQTEDSVKMLEEQIIKYQKLLIDKQKKVARDQEEVGGDSSKIQTKMKEKDLQLKRLTDKLRSYKEKNSALLIQFDSRVIEYENKLKFKDAEFNSYKQYINDHIESITAKMKEHEGQ